MVGLGLPADLPAIGWLDGLTDGFRDECDLVGASVAGGDITRCDLVVLGVTALGDLGGRRPSPRSGARPGDVVAVAGRLGHAAAGLALLQRGAVAGAGGADRRPPAPARLPTRCGPEAAGLGATAMLDVSDGLLQDLGHVAEAAGVALVLDPEAFPVPPAMAEAARRSASTRWSGCSPAARTTRSPRLFPAARTAPAEGWTVVGSRRRRGRCAGQGLFAATAAAGTTSGSDLYHFL